ncbi:MAG: GNAT family N-acetyltransferase [Leptolyngbya sp. SIO4C1]|nr:GNAT family N-acetyltransferase [Leptolyngbya sp. SIO4C1]
MQTEYRGFLIRDWQPGDRAAAAAVVKTVLAEYGLGWEVNCGASTDQDAVEIEKYYWQTGGEFWVVEAADQIIGTGGYYPIERGEGAVEIRKMYLLPAARGQGLGRFLLSQLEAAIAARHYQEIWVETATVLKEAVRLYEKNGYLPADGVETPRCDRVYYKRLSV